MALSWCINIELSNAKGFGINLECHLQMFGIISILLFFLHLLPLAP